jgi:hypothetical protein
VVSEEDRYHEVGTLYYLDLLDEGAHLLTSDCVLDETMTRWRYEFGHATALGFWHRIEQARKRGFLTVLWVDELVWNEAMAGFTKYDDQEFPFTDCTSFILARQQPVDEVFGFDRHFRRFGLVLKPSF